MVAVCRVLILTKFQMLTSRVHGNVDINKFSGGLRTEITELVNLKMLGLSEFGVVRPGTVIPLSHSTYK